jgi:hypothetical protein
MIPNLPTDSLYKFSAVAGLVIFVTGAFLLGKTLEIAARNDKLTPVLNLQADAWSARSDHALKNRDKKITRLNETAKQLAQSQAELKNAILIGQKDIHAPNNSILLKEAETKTVQVGKDLQSCQELIDSVNGEIYSPQTAALNEEAHKIISQRTELKVDLEMANFIFYLGFILMIIGILCSLIGFRCWYYRVQKHVDILIKKQADVEIDRDQQTQIADV